VSPAKTAEAIEMPFGLWTRVGSRNHVLEFRWSPDASWKWAIFRRKRAARYKVKGPSGFSCAKTAEAVKMPFGMMSRVDPGNHVLDGV